ncbi:MAG: hypothetical protein PHU75_09840 [Candidatus Nanopelagicales bacterium]|nr:hypothetical protein [Candidatus Nanopelagicales bacterium]
MTRVPRLLAAAAIATVAAAGLAACGSTSEPKATVASAPVPTVAASIDTAPALPAAGAPGGPVEILDGLLKTAADEHVITDGEADYESRGATGWQAATRAASNPLGNYRAQLLKQGWELTLDEPTRIAGERQDEWISLTTTDVQSLTGSLPWATVLAFAHLTVEPVEP